MSLADRVESDGDADGRAPVDPIGLAHANWTAAGWSDSADGMALVTSVMRVQQVLLQRVDELLRPYGLTFARFEVLMLLRFARHSLPLGKIGERLQVHPASVTNAVARLESAGLVVRTPNPADGRSVLAAITDEGRAVVGEAARLLNREIFSDVPLDDHDILDATSVLGRWRAAFGDF